MLSSKAMPDRLEMPPRQGQVDRRAKRQPTTRQPFLGVGMRVVAMDATGDKAWRELVSDSGTCAGIEQLQPEIGMQASFLAQFGLGRIDIRHPGAGAAASHVNRSRT